MLSAGNQAAARPRARMENKKYKAARKACELGCQSLVDNECRALGSTKGVSARAISEFAEDSQGKM